ncbi:MAG: glucosidase [Polyangiales bacterium]
MKNAEQERLDQDAARTENWKRWGPYLSERQWSTVREDYSDDSSSWEYFPHDHARSRAYRWGEDGILGVCDRQGRLCFSIAMWNGSDPILKERLFGLTGPEGNHGEDVKEEYFYLDSTPTHSYMKGLYKYPHAAFPYQELIDQNRSRSRAEREFELVDTGVFDQRGVFDVTVEYAKASSEDLLIRITVENRGEAEMLHLLPTLWFRNTWSWGQKGEEASREKPSLRRHGAHTIVAEHETLGAYRFDVDPSSQGASSGAKGSAPFLFTDNETNNERLHGTKNEGPWVKDAFHEFVIHGRAASVNAKEVGTKATVHLELALAARSSTVVQLRLSAQKEGPMQLFGASFDHIMRTRRAEADAFYGDLLASHDPQAKNVARQAYAGLLFSKQFYHYVVNEWIAGDPILPRTPLARGRLRNQDWPYLHCRDVISMPDKWEYPWFAAWDLAFHMIPFARVDPHFAKQQLILLLREWYMHPNGQLPAYEFNFSDVNPPVHAWAAFRVYKIAAKRGERDLTFLARVFQKLLVNFTWWVNRKDPRGNNLFSGGFLGLDNIGVFDRSKPLPIGGHLAQADGTAWMAFYCATMLSMALELSQQDEAYEDLASKFFEHFVAITDAMNSLGGSGLWDEQDGFYYDQIVFDGDQESIPIRVRSMVGIIPLFAVAILENKLLKQLKGFGQRARWFLENRTDLARHIAYLEASVDAKRGRRLLAIPSRDRLQRVLRYVLDENEFLSAFGVRSLSRKHRDEPYVLRLGGESYTIAYDPAESTTGLFGGNSNWRGPIWFPTNYLLIESLQMYHHFYGDSCKVECPVGSGTMLDLGDVARFLGSRLTRLFLPDATGARPCHGDDARFRDDETMRDLLLFHEYFDGDNGRGCGASHQTGWTALVVRLLEDLASES